MIDYNHAVETDRHFDRNSQATSSVVVQRLKYQGAFVGRNTKKLNL